jgi:pimeloyl-ACP methyl ester carboxylesterase
MTFETRTYPGARRPDRIRRHDADGVGIAVYEWGKETDPVVFLVHGGSDFAGTFDVFGPLIASAGWRVVTWDHRGHGDSDHAALYSWDADIRDALSVMSSVTTQAAPVVAHSKGGALMMQLTEASPYRVSKMVNIDGMPSKRRMPDVPDHDQSRLLAGEIGSWLDFRHDAIDAIRKPGTLEDLARRRAKMNPRLSIEWLEYLVTVGARHDADGWRWKLDPTMRFGGFGPWRPEWSALRMASLPIPFLGLLGTIDEPMGWGARARDILPWIPAGGRLEVLEDIGHFIHIEAPEKVSTMVLEFLS